MEQVTNQILSELQSYSSQEGAAAHIGFDSSCSHSLSISQLQAELSEDDLHLLKLKADNILYRIIAIELGITPYAVRRQLNALLTKISKQHSAEIFELAWALDLILDENNGESDFKSLICRLGLKRVQVKFLILLTRDFVKCPVEHYKERIFRINSELSRLS